MCKSKNSAHDRPLRKGINGWPKRGPAGLSYYGRNNSSTLQEIKKIKSGPEKCMAHHQTNPALEWRGKPKKSPHERSENTDGESPDHGKRMSSRQTLRHI